ncbi:MAG: (2Fe-2S)-binding protein [Gammaproteobacteria bacterium]|jgi:aerobic carbon-monoxide dehydrogenase small subunit|nr:(2Fe-2S)-binding protein [Gammaproteobacteria bacterium]MBT5201854.1 (2Fe-2S)-binding protein [Gammaproteobacteria bacterium]MBT5602630.1 (2Fe-2S)-binding protein [Gammaproteobacteria bacterium]MBT6244202.1 (2Fe-2S)-binding protein [Gammaproteobacteria bacterium]
MSETVNLIVNGQNQELSCSANTTLSQLLREHLMLTGTHVGCDTSQCGACTVHMDGVAVKSCTVLAGQVDGAEVTTIEGIAAQGEQHPMQAAFKECHGLQCGFCTPGMIMASIDLVQSGNDLSEKAIRKGLEGNICRCTGYHNIVSAVASAGQKMRES